MGWKRNFSKENEGVVVSVQSDALKGIGRRTDSSEAENTETEVVRKSVGESSSSEKVKIPVCAP
jgi:hypothetical protein